MHPLKTTLKPGQFFSATIREASCHCSLVFSCSFCEHLLLQSQSAFEFFNKLLFFLEANFGILSFVFGSKFRRKLYSLTIDSLTTPPRDTKDIPVFLLKAQTCIILPTFLKLPSICINFFPRYFEIKSKHLSKARPA